MRICWILLAISISALACRKSPKNPVSCTVDSGMHPYLKIVSNEDSPARAFNMFCKRIDVFGVPIFATPEVPDVKLMHAANVMAEYLDNNEDGVVDNEMLMDALRTNNAFLAIADKDGGLKKFFRQEHGDRTGQDLYASETKLVNGGDEGFDVSLEEVLHLITHAGYATAYPDAFGEHKDSDLAKAMDVARGGYFKEIPKSYPNDAWYAYEDPTCEYECMISEYIYWALTSHLGAQAFTGRAEEIEHEWRLNTPELIKAKDVLVYDLITNPIYKMPTVLPDGHYRE